TITIQEIQNGFLKNRRDGSPRNAQPQQLVLGIAKRSREFLAHSSSCASTLVLICSDDPLRQIAVGCQFRLANGCTQRSVIVNVTTNVVDRTDICDLDPVLVI